MTTPPCLTTDPDNLWLSDSRSQREIAAQLCDACPTPARTRCAQIAADHDVTFGVWAGQDLSRTVHRGTR